MATTRRRLIDIFHRVEETFFFVGDNQHKNKWIVRADLNPLTIPENQMGENKYEKL